MCLAGAEPDQMLAPRRQSLPQPHAAPSFIPTWAPTGPDTATHIGHATDAAAKHSRRSTSASCTSMYEQADHGMRDEAQDTHSHQEAASSTASDLALGSFDQVPPARSSASRQSAQRGQGPEDQQCFSPGCGSFQAAPAVNITITGACSCTSPAKMPPSTGAHEQAPPLAKQQSAAKLSAEASLAYLHQPAEGSGQARQLHSGTGDAGASCSSAAGPGAVQQEDVQRAADVGQADQAASGGIDTAALQKEVTELRQQARASAPTWCYLGCSVTSRVQVHVHVHARCCIVCVDLSAVADCYSCAHRDPIARFSFIGYKEGQCMDRPGCASSTQMMG